MSITCQANYRLSPRGNPSPECLPTGLWTQHQRDQWYWTADPLRWAAHQAPLHCCLDSMGIKSFNSPVLSSNRCTLLTSKFLQFHGRGTMGKNCRKVLRDRNPETYSPLRDRNPETYSPLRDRNPETYNPGAGGMETRARRAGTGSKAVYASP